jgi:hypothetical protein
MVNHGGATVPNRRILAQIWLFGVKGAAGLKAQDTLHGFVSAVADGRIPAFPGLP